MILFKYALNDAMSSNMGTTLNYVSNKARNTINMIDSFMTHSDDLKGKTYDAIRARLSVYKSVLQTQTELADSLKTRLNTANNAMIGFMEGYDMLDDGKIDEIENLIRTTESRIRELNNQLKNLSYAEHEALIRSILNDIQSCQEKLVVLKDKLEKLKQLAPTDASNFSIVEAYNSDEAFIMPNTGICGGAYITNDSVTPGSIACGASLYFFSQHGFLDENGNVISVDSIQGDDASKNYYINKWNCPGNFNIYDRGCNGTCGASILSTMTGTLITPTMIGEDVYVPGKNMDIEMMHGTFAMNYCSSHPEFGITAEACHNIGSPNKQIDIIDSTLKSGGAVMLQIKFQGKTKGNTYEEGGGHWIAILGKRPDGTYIVNDPYSDSPSSTCTWNICVTDDNNYLIANPQDSSMNYDRATSSMITFTRDQTDI